MTWLRGHWPWKAFAGLIVVLGMALFFLRHWIQNNWPSFSNSWDLPFGTLTDLIGICVGLLVLCMTLWIARRQFRIMNKQTSLIEEQKAIAVRQTAMMEEQNEASKRIERLTEEQAAIAKRQGEILESQHKLAEQQRARVPKPRVFATGGISRREETSEIGLYIYNAGTRTLRDFYWTIYIPGVDSHLVLVADTDESENESAILYGAGEVDQETENLWRVHRGYWEGPIHPGDSWLLGSVMVTNNFTKHRMILRWSINTDAGHFPNEGEEGLVGTENVRWPNEGEPSVDK